MDITTLDTNAWILQGQNGVDSLEQTSQKLPELEDYDVLVELHAASLNHRDVAVAEVCSKEQSHSNTAYTLYRVQ